MTTETLLTFAELEFLLARDPLWSWTRERLGLLPPLGAVVPAAGLASLAARGLVTLRGTDVVVGSEPAGAIALLSERRGWLEIACEREGVALGAYVGLAEGRPILFLSLAAPGVFEIRVATSDGPTAELFADVMSSLAQTCDAVIAGIARGEADEKLQVRRQADDRLRARKGGEGEGIVLDQGGLRRLAVELAELALSGAHLPVGTAGEV